jgi:threonine dehydratase
MNNAVKQTLLARVYDVAITSPLDQAPILSDQLGATIYLKREDLQPVHSFKLRGAYNKMAQLTPAERKNGVIAASAGNHAQGVALAAKKLGISALIVMPRTTPSIKVEAVTAYDGEVELAGDSYSDAADHCKIRAQETGRTYVHPFDDPLVIAGQGTIGRELLEQLPQVTHIFVPVGGGGLIAGISQYVKALRPDVQIIGVEPEDSNVMQASLRAKKRVTLSHVGIFADGVAVKQLGEHTFAIAREFVDDSITVGTDQICAAIKSMYQETRAIVEPAGALGIAGVIAYAQAGKLEGAHAVAICSGANMTFERLQFVAERTLLGSNKEALFAITLPETPGALQALSTQVIENHGITQLCYRLTTRNQAHIFLGLSVADSADRSAFTARLKKYKYAFADLSLEDTAKEHIRHMIGGSSSQIEHEHVYRINFPERPGALHQFLKSMGDAWNISLFHYRGPGGDEVSVLIGFEATNRQALEASLRNTGYSFTRVDHDESLKRFVGASR